MISDKPLLPKIPPKEEGIVPLLFSWEFSLMIKFRKRNKTATRAFQDRSVTV